MRIVGGELGGRSIQAPSGTDTRPMTDRTREALFNILGDIVGLRVLDAYAGSGAVGFEALSRGASHVDAVEKNHLPIQAIKNNLAKLELNDRYNLFSMPMEKWLQEPNTQRRYDLIFFCPPHKFLSSKVLGQTAKLLKQHGLLIVEHAAKDQTPMLSNSKLLKTVSHSASTLSIFQV